MKIRIGFVSNSSSCSFMITNKTDRKKRMSDFAEETIFLVEKFFVEYQSENSKVKKSTICDFKNMFVVHTKLDNRIIFRGDNEIIFGDHSKQYHQTVFDYMLREGGETDSFKWKLIRMNR